MKENGITLINFINQSQNFIDYIDVDNKTLKAYSAGIKSFINFLKENGVNTPKRDDVIAFRDMLRDNYSSATVNLYITSLKALFNYLEVNGIYQNITKDVKGAKWETTPKKQVLSVDQVKTIYNELTNSRDRALFSLFVTTGLRGIEVERANIEDIKVYNGEVVLFVQGKKRDSKDEYVKLSDKVLNDLKEYLEDRTYGALFVSTSNENYGERLSSQSMRKIVKNIFKKYGLNDSSFSLHSLRRTNAVISYESGSSIYDIQQVLRHSSINTTTRYLQQVNRDNNKTEFNVSDTIFG